MGYGGLGQDIRTHKRMGCDKCTKFTEICKRDEPKFESLLSKYCGSGGEEQSSLQKSTNFGFVNFVSDEESTYDIQECSCSMYWTDWLEIIIAVILALFVCKYLKNKFDDFQSAKRSKKLTQMQAFFSRLPSDSKTAMHPTAPVVTVTAPDIYPSLSLTAAETSNAKPWLSN